MFSIVTGRKRAVPKPPPMTRKDLKMIAPESVYKNEQAETLADVRQYVARYPEAVGVEAGELARCLGRDVTEVEAALEWMIQDGLEVPA